MDTTVQKNDSMSVETYQEPRTSTRSLLYSIFESLPIRVFAVGVTYLSGYWKMSPLWIILAWGVFKYRDEKRLKNKYKQEAAKAVALRNEMKLVLTNVDPLPSWVYFPDAEQCEWLNTVICHLWSSIQPIVVDNLKKLEPTFNDIMSNYKKNPNFSFKKINLGSLTPRVSGVRVYDKDSYSSGRSIIDIYMFFFSDSVFSCSLMSNITFGGENFEIKGCLRIIISTIEGSFFPGVEVYFLQQPKVGFNLTGILNIGDIPGLSGLIRNTVDSVIASKLVLPNKFVIKYDNRVDLGQLIFPDPKGLLRVNVIEARALGGTRRFLYSSSKKPNPYLIITFGSKTFTSRVVKNSTDPVWNFTAEFIIDSLFEDTVTISVDGWEERHTDFTAEDFIDDTGTVTVPVNYNRESQNLGTTSFGLKLVQDKKKFNSWVQLEGVVTGMVHLDVSYHKLENNPELLASNDLPAILEVLIDDAKNLDKMKDKVLAEISVGEVTQSSRPVPTNNPVFREVFSFPVKNPKTDKLRIKLINENGEKALGNTEFDIKQILEANNMEVINEQTTIKGANENSRLSISMRLRTLKS